MRCSEHPGSLLQKGVAGTPRGIVGRTARIPRDRATDDTARNAQLIGEVRGKCCIFVGIGAAQSVMKVGSGNRTRNRQPRLRGFDQR
jgi:hypothetical protein